MSENTRTELEEDEAALIFSKDGSIRAALPNMDEDDDVPPHILEAVAWMIASQDDDIRKLVNSKFNEGLKDQIEKDQAGKEEI